METMRVANVEAAIQLATQLKREGRYDWFRGQVRCWPLQTSLHRKLAGDGEAHAAYVERLGRFMDWAAGTPQLAYLSEGANADALFAILQHYGFPTNYVDFTTDPAVAGFFSADCVTPPKDAGDSVIYCLDTDDLRDFYADFDEDPETEKFKAAPVSIDVSNLWRLQAQGGYFLFINHDLEALYGPLDRIVFPWTGYPAYPPREQIYPVHKSALEQLLDQYFFVEKSVEESRRFFETIAGLKRAGAKIGMALTTARPEGYLAEHFSVPLEPLPGWAPDLLVDWRQPRSEPFGATVGRFQKIVLRDDPGAPTAAEQVEGAILSALSRDAGLRGQAVEWMFSGATGPLASDGFAGAFRAGWNGLRALPYADEDIATALGSLVALWSDADCRSADGHIVAAAFRRRWPDAREVEFATADGAYSKGWCSDAGLLAAIDESWKARLTDRSEAVTVWRALQLTQHPNLLFDFGRFARLFCRYIVPSQLAGGRSLTLFNPADLWRLGLP